MNNTIKFAGLLVAGSLVSGQAFAGTASLGEVTDYYVNAAAVTTTHEIQNQVYSDILNTTHKIEIDTLDIETRVLISSAKIQADIDKEAAE